MLPFRVSQPQDWTRPTGWRWSPASTATGGVPTVLMVPMSIINLLFVSNYSHHASSFDFAAKQVSYSFQISTLRISVESRHWSLCQISNLKTTSKAHLMSGCLTRFQTSQIGPKRSLWDAARSFPKGEVFQSALGAADLPTSQISTKVVPKQRQRRSPNKWKTHRPKHMFIQVSLLLSWIRIGLTFLLTSINCFMGLIDVKKKTRQRQTHGKTEEITTSLKHCHISDCCHPREQHGPSHLASSCTTLLYNSSLPRFEPWNLEFCVIWYL